MIKTITVTNHLEESITIELGSPEKSGFLIRSIDGLGPSTANIQMTEMSLMDGSLYNSARALSRNIVLSLTFIADASQEITIEDIRQKSYKYFPLKQRIKISIETDNRFSETYGFVESNTPNIFSKEEGTTISILCPDSYLFSSEMEITIFNALEPVFEFPFGNESLTVKLLEFSTLSAVPMKSIYYPGDAEIGLVFNIHALGDIEMVEIYNLETNETMTIDTSRLEELTGEGFHAGDDIIISTVKGDKYVILVRDGLTTNILNCIDKYPNWFQLVKGDNIFAYTAEVGETNIQVRLENQVAYEGI
jgi:hypothetical protein